MYSEVIVNIIKILNNFLQLLHLLQQNKVGRARKTKDQLGVT